MFHNLHPKFRPMLAGKCDIMQLRYPIAVTPKIDGVRVITGEEGALSRSLKPIQSQMVQLKLSKLPPGLDGEVIATDGTFRTSIRTVMSWEYGDVNWVYHIFDYLNPESETIAPYSERMMQLKELQDSGRLNRHCEILAPTYVYDKEHLEEITKEHLDAGFEGTMVRKPDGTYKFGRSTQREQLLLKVKAFEDAEARIIGVEELMHNDNEAETNELGLTSRSSHQANQRPAGTLGALVVQSLENPDITFKIGTGFTAQDRQEMWDKQDELIGQLAKFKFFNQGILLRPRHPVFLGIRPEDDM